MSVRPYRTNRTEAPKAAGTIPRKSPPSYSTGVLNQGVTKREIQAWIPTVNIFKAEYYYERALTIWFARNPKTYASTVI